MRWTPAAVNVRVDDGRAVFSSEGFAWGVCLDLDGETALADNFFDVYPGQPYSIAWPHAEPPRILFTANAPPTAGP
jgi:beta-mannosidase